VAAIFVGSSSGSKKDKSKKKMSKLTPFLLLLLATACLEVNPAAGSSSSSSSSCQVWSDLDEAVTAYVKEAFGNSVVGGECSIFVWGENRRR
jgi:hypothetical protein